jgi:hypothetical protein
MGPSITTVLGRLSSSGHWVVIPVSSADRVKPGGAYDRLIVIVYAGPESRCSDEVTEYHVQPLRWEPVK